MIENILFGRRRAYKVVSLGVSRVITGRSFNLSGNGELNIYDSWGAKVASLREVQAIIEVED